MKILTARIAGAALAASLLLSACGGSGGGSEPAITGPQPTTGQVALLFTDKPTDEFSAIKFNVIEAALIGGQGVGGQQHFLFKGEEPIDLLNLTNFSEPVVFGEVDAGIYTKLRLIIDALELVPLDGGPSQYPPLPANGKIDLLDPDGIEVLPGRTLIVEIDMDANKAIHIVGAGKSGQYRFRPVVKATFMDGDLGELPDKLARLEGTVSMIYDDPAGGFELCDIETPDSCVDVATHESTGIFGSDGTPTDFSTLMPNDPVVVIGNYTVDGGIVLHAVVLEIGGNAEQVRGNVVSDPADSQFLLLPDLQEGEMEATEIIVELQDGTKYYDENGALGAESIVLGTDVEVEGVVEAGTPDLMRAALVFIMAEEDEQLSGTIDEPLNAADGDTPANFVLVFEDMTMTCVNVYENTDVLLVDVAASEVTMGDFTNLAKDQVVDVFGQSSAEPDGCFEANEVIVDLNASPST